MQRRQSERHVQLTVRSVPAGVKKVLAARARKEQKSLNSVLVEVLSAAAGAGAGTIKFRDLSSLSGKWVEDPGFDEALRIQDQIDDELWS